MELLIAMTVFAVMTTLAFSGLQIVLDTRERVEKETLLYDHLRVAFSIIERDVEQAVSREVRDEHGGIRASVIGGSFNSISLELSRSGWENPLNQKRSTLQRVGYRLEDKGLYRIRWRQLDRTSDDQFDEVELMGGVTEFEVRFLRGLEWQTSWPPPLSNISSSLQAQAGINQGLPNAIEITLDVENVGKITRLFRVAGAY